MRIFAYLILLLSVNACEDDIDGFLAVTSLTEITCEQAYLELHSNCHYAIPTAPEYNLWSFCCAYCTCPDCTTNSPSYVTYDVTYEPTVYGYGETASPPSSNNSKEPYESTAFILICTGLTFLFVFGWVILYFQLTNKGFWEPERAKKLQPFDDTMKEANLHEVQKITVEEESEDEEQMEPSSAWVDSPRSFSEHARHQSSHSHIVGRRNHTHARYNSAPAHFPPPGYFPGAGGPPPVFNPYTGVAPSYFGHTPGMPPTGGAPPFGGIGSRLGPGNMGPMMQPPPGPMPHMGYYNPHHPSRPLESSQYSRGHYNDEESSQETSTSTSSQSGDKSKEDSDPNEEPKDKEDAEENSGTSAPKDDDRRSSEDEEEEEEVREVGGDSMERIDVIDKTQPEKRFVQTVAASNDSSHNQDGIHQFFT